jgi:thiamine phosphate synthase YjbQ (UPF0047 family)
LAPLELRLELTPRARLDVIDVRAKAAEHHGPVLDEYPRVLYFSYHTTAGYLPQSVASRLAGGEHHLRGVGSYIDVFRALFPEGAGYRHDQLDARTDLTDEQRPVEPTNADSHLAFIAGGLEPCVSYSRRPGPVHLIDLDGIHQGGVRTRQALLVGYHREELVARTRLAVPVSAHPIDAVNLKEHRLGLYDELAAFVRQHDVRKGRLRLELPAGEQHAGLTVNEYETLLMRHDLVEVLRDPLRFAKQTVKSAWNYPGDVPMRAIEHAKYDFVHALNRLVDLVGLGESRVERLVARAIALPAQRYLRMRRSVSLPVSDSVTRNGHGAVVQGQYQSPILIQWQRAPQAVRHVDVTLTRFD